MSNLLTLTRIEATRQSGGRTVQGINLPPSVVSSLQAGQSYAGTLQSSGSFFTVLNAALAAFPGCVVVLGSQPNIYSITFTWSGTSGAATPAVAGATWLTLQATGSTGSTSPASAPPPSSATSTLAPGQTIMNSNSPNTSLLPSVVATLSYGQGYSGTVLSSSDSDPTAAVQAAYPGAQVSAGSHHNVYNVSFTWSGAANVPPPPINGATWQTLQPTGWPSLSPNGPTSASSSAPPLSQAGAAAAGALAPAPAPTLNVIPGLSIPTPGSTAAPTLPPAATATNPAPAATGSPAATATNPTPAATGSSSPTDTSAPTTTLPGGTSLPTLPPISTPSSTATSTLTTPTTPTTSSLTTATATPSAVPVTSSGTGAMVAVAAGLVGVAALVAFAVHHSRQAATAGGRRRR